MKAISLMATARTNKQEQVTRMRIKVVAERSPALLVLIVLMSWGMPINVPVTKPIQLMTWERSTFQLLCAFSRLPKRAQCAGPKRTAGRHQDRSQVWVGCYFLRSVPPQLRGKGLGPVGHILSQHGAGSKRMLPIMAENGGKRS